MNKKSVSDYLQGWKKDLYYPLEMRQRYSQDMVHQLRFLEEFILNNSFFGSKHLIESQVNTFNEQAQSLKMDTSPINSIFCVFVDMITYNMRSYLELMEKWSSSLRSVIESVEDSDQQLSESWKDAAGELMILVQSMISERSKQRTLAEELQRKYDSKGNVDHLKKDLIIRERRYRESYKEIHSQVESFRESYEKERERIEQSMFFNTRDSQKLLTCELNMYCEVHEKLLEKLRNSSRNAKLQISKIEMIDKFVSVKPTSPLPYDPFIPEYDRNGEGKHIIGTPRTPSKLSTFFHFVKKNNSELRFNLPEIPLSSKSKDDADIFVGITDIQDSDNEDEDDIDEEFHGLHLFQNYEKNDQCTWFENYIDSLAQEPTNQKQEISLSEMPSSNTSNTLNTMNNSNTNTVDQQLHTYPSDTEYHQENISETDLLSSTNITSLSSDLNSSTSITVDNCPSLDSALKMLDTREGRLAFAMAMNFKRRNSNVPKHVLETFAILTDKAITLAYEKEDPNVGRFIVNMAHTYYYEVITDPNSEPIRVYLHSKLRNHPVWKEIRFWEANFYDSLSSERIRNSQLKKWKNLGTKQKEELILSHENTVFGILGSFSYSMLTLGLKVDEVRAFVEKMCRINSLSEEYCSQIEESVEVTAKAVRSTHLTVAMRRLTLISSPQPIKEDIIEKSH